MSYSILRNIHITCVIISLSFFSIRGCWMMLDSALLQKRVVKILPHIIDTALLLSAIGLILKIQQYPLTDHWLSAKVLALIVYIALGAIAITYGKTKKQRLLAFSAALLTACYIVIVAIHHHPWPFGA